MSNLVSVYENPLPNLKLGCCPDLKPLILKEIGEKYGIANHLICGCLTNNLSLIQGHEFRIHDNKLDIIYCTEGMSPMPTTEYYDVFKLYINHIKEKTQESTKLLIKGVWPMATDIEIQNAFSESPFKIDGVLQVSRLIFQYYK